jgi:hypothetical protein
MNSKIDQHNLDINSQHERFSAWIRSKGIKSSDAAIAVHPFEAWVAALRNNSPERKANMQPNENFVDVVFDGPPAALPGRFIEVESSSGNSIDFGTWLHRPDGYWALRVAVVDGGASKPEATKSGQVEPSETLTLTEVAALRHEDRCRFHEDGEFCTCGAREHEILQRWIRYAKSLRKELCTSENSERGENI